MDATVTSTEWDLAPGPESIGTCRKLVRDTLKDWDLPGETIDDVVLMLSELTTNALRHGRKPIKVELKLSGRCVGGEVTDSGGVFRVPPPRASDDAVNGRGLQIVDSLATKWAIDPNPHGGKTVWFQRCW